MSKYNWDTNELLDTILNDEDLYLSVMDRTWSSDEIRNWATVNLDSTVDFAEVDWEQVADFIAEEVSQ